MIQKTIYTFYTNNGKNLLCGFHDTESFIEYAKKSIESAKKYVGDVEITGDKWAKQMLLDNGINEKFIEVDYNDYDFNPSCWNYPKILNYASQNEPFIHIDFDVILKSKPNNLDAILICEKIRGVNMIKQNLSYLPKVLLDNYHPQIPCSGIYGGNDVSLFKKLGEFAEILSKNRGDIDSNYRNVIEEFVMASICNARGVYPQAIECDFEHIQSSAEKFKLLFNKDIEI